MKILVADATNFLFFLVIHLIACTEAQAKGKSSKAYGHSSGYSKPKFISFNSDEGHIDIDWDVTIPFISIPLKQEIGENGEVLPLVNVNTKALGIAGLVTTILTMVLPIFSKPHTAHNYRSIENNYWFEMGNILNDVVFGNNYVAPCAQRIVCSIVAAASRSDSQSSVEKIIDGFSTHRWFKDAMNGTIIQDAVSIGREGDEKCAHIYKDCSISPKLFKTLMAQVGVM